MTARRRWSIADSGSTHSQEVEVELDKEVDKEEEDKEEEDKEEEEDKKEDKEEEEEKENIIHGNPPTKCVVWVHQLKMSLLCKWSQILICLNPSSWRIKKDSSKLFKNVSL